MKEPKIMSLIKLSVLLLLNEGEKHGYEIIKELESRYDKKISAGEIYPFLKDLKKNKIILVKETGAREKKVYSVTKAGKVFINKILSRFDDIIDHAVKSKLNKCSHCGCELYKGGFYKTIEGKKIVFCCEACAKMFRH